MLEKAARFRHLAGIVAVLVALQCFSTPAMAAEAPSALRIDPGRLDITVQPGQKYSGKFSVSNTTNGAITVRLYAADRITRPGGKVEAMKGTKLANSAAPWIATSNFDEPVLANQTGEFDLAVSAPDDARPGDYTAMVFAEVVQKGPLTSSAPADRAGILVVVGVPGERNTNGKIVQLNSLAERVSIIPRGIPRLSPMEIALPPSIRRSVPMVVTFSFLNEGSSKLAAEAEVVVSSGGKVVATIPAGTANEVFPGDASDFAAVWPDPPVFGTFNITARVTVGAPRTIEDGFQVYVFPWPLVPPAIVGFLVLVAIVMFVRRAISAREFDDVAYLPSRGGSSMSPRSATWATSVIPRPPLPRAKRPTLAKAADTSSAVGLAESARTSDVAAVAPPGGERVPDDRDQAVTVSGRPSGYAASLLTERSSLDADRGVLSIGRSPEVERLLGAGLAALQLSARADAYRYFATALAHDENCVEGWLLKAGTAESLREAEESLKRALALDPTNAWAVEGLRLLAESDAKV